MEKTFKEIFDNYREKYFVQDGAFDFEYFLTMLASADEIEEVLQRVENIS